MKKFVAKINWGYWVVLLFTTLGYVLVRLLISNNDVGDFISNTIGLWITVVGGMTALCGGFFFVFLRWMTTEFGDWLHWRKADDIFRIGLIYSLSISITTLVLLIIVA